jgi:ion channel
MLSEVLVAFLIVSIGVVIHTIGMLIFAEWMLRRWSIAARHHGLSYHAFMLIMVFCVIILLHVLQTSLWATFYYWQQLFENYETSLYFSMTSYTTIGFGDIVLPKRWRLLGAIEGVSGVLLCGLSTAFIFAIVNALLRRRIDTPQTHDAAFRDYARAIEVPARMPR